MEQEQYVIRGGRYGFERLRVLARARLADTSELFDRVGIRPGWECLDVGCGSGDVTLEIARRIGAGGRVTGVDMDETKLALARAFAAEQQVSNVDFTALDVNDLRDDAAYDLVYCRFVLQHLSRPVDLLRRMWAAVRTSGALVVEDADFDGLFCDPPNAGFEFYARTYSQVLERRGGDPAVGRKLYRHFLAAGIPAPELKVVQCADAIGERKTLAHATLEATAPAIVAENVATQEAVHAALESLGKFIEDPTSVVGEPRTFQLWARR